ncbi:zinc ribbon-containing protein [Aeromonas schubertii]|uniref:Zinc ribbon-containing protein n=1 Tax=Aeromonas schubertii TaxID=652 RepID=A0ABS7V7W7_9GAMM|nr:zinc ribbon-containing protein [Aeromonas schubertii]KUE79477.1 hypothetical protein ATO46_05520 [Aeromonas schubertii]MBZ6065499.1 zinc ribbon-containing protein [Aeromonas schubertii]MBZ6072243.1 zinc ribbon-containing protein [Aeromonas schubertii]QCG49148.1 hypothetical protein E2P79_16185 [Aeromonas schubertii]
MDKQKKGYEAFIEELRAQWEATGQYQEERLNRLIARVQAYLEAAGDLTRDEWALIAEYVKRDLGNFDEGRQDTPESEFTLLIKDSIWSWLVEATDRTQVEWAELAADLEHKGEYRSGDWVGLGVMVCRLCGHRHTVLRPERLGECIQCGATAFVREPLSP